MQTEELIYCMHCGAANKKSAVTCIECEKKLNAKGSPFLDYIKDHIKDDLQGKVKDNVFSALKNYLLSHLYGAVLALCVIATVGMSIYAAKPPQGVESVHLHPDAAAALELQKDADLPASVDMEAIFYALDELMDSYDLYVDSRTGEPGTSPIVTRPTDDIFAQPYLPAYASAEPHDFLNSEFHTMRPPSNEIGYQGGAMLRFDSLRYGKDCRTDLSKRLQADGYTTTEINCVAFWTPDAERVAPMEEIIADAIFLEEYLFTFVDIDGTWYIASDVRI